MIEYEKINMNMALDIAIQELRIKKIKYIKETFHANYSRESISIGSNKGWLISVKLDVPETFEPDMIFIEVSDPEGIAYIPPVL